ncbi:RebB family R body protein [Pedobacter sp. BG31]|jgi:Killing trait|uniref:RebB family R body protein n=1 Tax=Pedobacter TaxID=84567 RepID=UPI0011A6C3D9|nr:RebB family R body protein [Pedobacter suwonensis]
MAETVNSQVTDSITESSLEVIGNAPAIAIGNLYQATAQALANAAHNATVAQQQANILGQAVTAQGVALIYAIKI